jgi:prepilin-type processing-associated H-X9-DG protein
VGEKVGETVLWIKNRSEIVSPTPARRMVFIDEGAATPGSFWVEYNWYMWHDTPSVRHNDGTTVSWADGHASEYRWKAAETMEYGRRLADYYWGGGFIPKTPEGLQDLRDFQQAVWGRVGY